VSEKGADRPVVTLSDDVVALRPVGGRSSTNSSVQAAFLDVGVAADASLPRSLPQVVGSARARELMFLQGRFDSEEALDLALVSEVYSAGVQRTGPDVEATLGALTRKRDPI
jgi:2-(1,2-epoxy-1,2-dihydrophenyl)acetyl-CoA isomerase